MSYSLVQAKTAAGTGTSVTVSCSGTTAGNLLVLLIGTANNPGNNTVTAPTGWSQADSTADQNTFIGITGACFYLANCGSGITSVTATLNAAPSQWDALLLEFSGVATASPVDVTAHALQNNTNATSGTVSATTTANGDLLVGFLIFDETVTNIEPAVTEPTGWTHAATEQDINGWLALDAGWNSQATAGSATYNPTWTSHGDAILYILAFKAASGGGGSTPVTLADSGTGADSLTVQATVPLADSGTGADSLTVSATVPLTESGMGADSLTVQASVPLTDAGTGANSLNSAIAGTFTDSGTGSDILSSLNVTLGLTENGAGTDNLSNVLVTLALTDSGTGADSLTLGNPIAFSDAGAGAETFTLAPIAITLTDSGTGNDGAFSLAPLTFTLAESGTGSDALIVGGATVPGLCTVSDSAVGLVVVSDSAVGLVTLSDSAVAVCAVSDSPAEVN